MLPWSTEPNGRFDEHVVESELLRGNPLGDPHLRPLWVYMPPGYDDDPERRYPSVYVLQGLTGQLDMWRNRASFRRNFPELVDELAAPCLVVFVDAWTSLGGSQFVDSPGTGRYGSDFRDAARALRDHYDCSFERFWADFRSRQPFSRKTDYPLLNAWCMAACYSTDEDGTVRLPFVPETGELVPEVWERWLAWDPVRMTGSRADAARGLRAIYIDSGKRDQF